MRVQAVQWMQLCSIDSVWKRCLKNLQRELGVLILWEKDDSMALGLLRTLPRAVHRTLPRAVHRTLDRRETRLPREDSQCSGSRAMPFWDFIRAQRQAKPMARLSTRRVDSSQTRLLRVRVRGMPYTERISTETAMNTSPATFRARPEARGRSSHRCFNMDLAKG